MKELSIKEIINKYNYLGHMIELISDSIEKNKKIDMISARELLFLYEERRKKIREMFAELMVLVENDVKEFLMCEDMLPYSKSDTFDKSMNEARKLDLNDIPKYIKIGEKLLKLHDNDKRISLNKKEISFSSMYMRGDNFM